MTASRGVWTALLVVQLAFGSLGVAGKIAFAAFPPLAVALVRLASAALILWAIERALVPRDAPRPTRRDLLVLSGFALLGVVANQMLFLSGLARTTATNATLLVSTIPVFTVLVAAALGRERLTWRRSAAVATALAGVVLLVGADALDFGRDRLVGNAMIVANSLCYGAYLVLSRPYAQRFDPITIIAWTFTLGAVLGATVAIPSVLAVDLAAAGAREWLALAWVVVVGTALAYGLNTWVLRRLDSGTVAAFIPLQPMVAAVLAWPALGEVPGPRTLLAGAVILAGVALAASDARYRRGVVP